MARSRALDGFPEGFRGRIGETPEEIERFGRDASPDIGHPAAAVAPADAEDVAILVRWARAHRRPLVARGGGTSLEGSAVPPDGGVVVDFSGWTSIGPVDAMSRTVEVGPGVLNRDLHAHLQPDRLFFPPNPGSWTTSTIGGNVATNASGPRSLRYGATRRWVRELEVVLGTGERLRLGSPLAKRSVGPDLLGLLVGSEGTLGLVTSVRLDLAGSPARRAGLVVPIPPSAPLGRFARGLVGARDLGLSALEYLDGPSATELSREVGSRLPGGAPLLLAEIESADEESEGRALERFATTLRALGAPSDPLVYPDADELWTRRGRSGTVLDRRYGERVREDVGVPLDRLDEL
ncbi:MAG TPA: FAD-binding oxidoreductase, partial [Thermoplasmata archaeon]|nr:FAD-binding oxidoreductase [Thermoplasmata archaeon]